uniref:RING-type domain-containing protein n=1 Tax=Cyanistes caeruleus TaxID=156563 RepID=A0A8C0VE08_CYACU
PAHKGYKKLALAESSPGAAMAEVRQEPSAPRPVRFCRICVDFLQRPAAVQPCGHVFCHACIQPQAAPDANATCPVCQGPIESIPVLKKRRGQGTGDPAPGRAGKGGLAIPGSSPEAPEKVVRSPSFSEDKC